MARRIIFIIWLLSILPFSNSSAEALRIDAVTTSVQTEPYLRFVSDPSNEMGVDDVLALPAEQWRKLPNNNPSFGFTSDSYWFELNLYNHAVHSLDLFIHLDYSQLDDIQFFGFDLDGSSFVAAETYLTGDRKPYENRPIDNPTFLFPVTIASKQAKKILLRVNTKGVLQAPMTIWQQESFWLEAQDSSFLYGFFLSALLIMSAYYLCLFAIVRDKSYLLYCVYIVCMAGVHASLDGYAYKWFWPDASGWHQISSISFIAIGLIAVTYFTRALLPIPQNSLLDRATQALGILAITTAFLSVFLPYQNAAMLHGIMTVIVMSSVIVTCLLMLRQSPRIAKFFCFAWSAYFAGILLKSVAKFGVLPSNVFTEYSGNIGAVVGVIIIALALADRINSERREKEKAQEESINNLKRFETLYDNALEGIFTLSESGQLLSANPAFLKLIGLKDPKSFDGDWFALDGYRLEEKHFIHLLKAVKSQGHVIDFETQMVDSDGGAIWVNISARHLIEGGIAKVDGTLINISERKAFEQQLQHLAEHDPLTGFFNRRAFESTAKEMLEQVQSYEEKACLLYLDLDQFKIVNDLCGHTAGDMLLKKLSQRLLDEVSKLGEQQVIARLGGDEFGILLSQMSLPKARHAAEQLRQAVEEFLFVWEGKRYAVGVSIGLVELLPYHQTVEQVLVMADTACYMAKDQGRNRVHVFVESDKDLQFRQLEMQWVNTIKEALNKDQFFLVFQNIANNSRQETSHHYEILIRLMNSNGNLCSPGQFLPAAERYSLMPSIDKWVVKNYFKWLRDNPDHLEALSCASINLSTQSIGDESFSHFLVESFKEYDIPADKVCFEITEGMAIVHMDNTQSFIERFRSLGCRFALDDFGTGFSSYAYLKELSVDYLKIDGVFIENLCQDEVNTAMVRSISDVARAIGIETVAEFVENEETRQKLIELGINFSQGYHVHQPTKLEAVAFSNATQSG